MAVKTKLQFRSKTWSATEGEGIQINDGQAFRTADQIKFDIQESYRWSTVVAELRLFSAEEGSRTVHGGTLRLIGEGVWAVRCEGR